MPHPQEDSITALGELDPRTISRDEFAALLQATSAALAEEGRDLSALTPQQFARLVSRASSEQLEAVLERPDLCRMVLDEVFRRMREHYTGGDAEGVVRWRIDTGDDLLRWECALAGGECVVTRGSSDAEPRTTLTVAPLEFVKLTSGNTSPAKLLMTRRLKVSGDLSFAANLPKLFRIPRP